MKFRSIFDLINDARDIVDAFEGVESVEQMVSRLERLKRRDADEFLINVKSMQVSINAALDDVMEMGGRIDDGSEEDEDDEEDFEGLEDLEKEDEKSSGEKPPEEPKTATKA